MATYLKISIVMIVHRVMIRVVLQALRRIISSQPCLASAASVQHGKKPLASGIPELPVSVQHG